jgi:hypothetical protein
MRLIYIILFSITFASSRRVPQQYNKIQDAINNSSSGDIIVISPGKYSPSTNKEIFPIQLKSKSNITIIGSGTESTIIDAENSNRVMFFHSVDNIIIKDLIIRGGYLNSYGINNDGGGLKLTNSNITLENISISENNAWIGGAISLKNSIINFNENITLKNNRGLKEGAAIAFFSHSKINGDYISKNNKVGIFDSYNYRQNEIALVTKVKGKVNYKKYNSITNLSGLRIGTDLFDKDTIKTGNDGFAIYIYLDDKSLIKIHNNTEIVINRNKTQNNFSNNVELNHGIIKVFIDPNRKNDFKIITPTSVASVKGTEFWVMRNKFTQIDQFICETGLIEIKNLFSGNSVLINKMKAAISELNGILTIKDHKFINIPKDKIVVFEKVEEKKILEIGKGDKAFIRILKYCSIIGAGLVTYSLLSF